MSKIEIKSCFEQISEQVFSMKNLDEAKTFVINFIKEKHINEKDKQSILKEINQAKTLVRFQQYIANALLKYEGMGVNQMRKTSKEAAIDDSNI